MYFCIFFKYKNDAMKSIFIIRIIILKKTQMTSERREKWILNCVLIFFTPLKWFFHLVWRMLDKKNKAEGAVFLAGNDFLTSFCFCSLQCQQEKKSWKECYCSWILRYWESHKPTLQCVHEEKRRKREYNSRWSREYFHNFSHCQIQRNMKNPSAKKKNENFFFRTEQRRNVKELSFSLLMYKFIS